MSGMAAQPEEQLGRRERSKRRVRERLYRSALELFAENGYDRTTIDQIAERADVARGTFFNYFQRKEDIVIYWASTRSQRLEARLAEEAPHASGAGVTVRLEQCVAILAEFNETERDITPTMLSAWVRSGRPISEDPYTAKVFADIIEHGRQQGEIATDVDPTRVGNLLRDAYLGALYRWARDPDANPPLHIELRELLRVILTGILPYPQRGRTASAGSPKAHTTV